MKYRKKITYLGILCKTLIFNMKLKEIHAFKVVEYLTTHFGRFRIFLLLAGGMARHDIIIYKLDHVLHYNERNCYNFNMYFVTNV